jgi:hypothetical protein
MEQSTQSIELDQNAYNVISYCQNNIKMLLYEKRPLLRVLGYRSGGPGSIPSTTRKKKVMGLERGPLSLVSTTEELLDRKVAAPV